jgi:hypothetical protein
MPDDDTAAYSALPRIFAWIIGFRHSAVWLGAAVGALYLLIAAAELSRSGLPSSVRWAFIVADALTYAGFFAGIPVAISILVRGLERDVRDLAPVLSATGNEASPLAEAFSVKPRAVWIGVAVGLIVTLVVLSLILTVDPARRFDTLFLTLREIVVEVATFAVLGWAVGAALRLSRLTEERAHIDLLEPNPFAPLARHGARLAAVWLVAQSLAIPSLLYAPEWIGEDLVRSGVFLIMGMACFAGIFLIVPCLGAHRVLRSAKRTGLETVRSQIGETRRTREDARLPGLLAWETRIEGLSEWPIDAAALGRTGMFVLLPAASWVASAIVARFVDASMR